MVVIIFPFAFVLHLAAISHFEFFVIWILFAQFVEHHFFALFAQVFLPLRFVTLLLSPSAGTGGFIPLYACSDSVSFCMYDHSFAYYC